MLLAGAMFKSCLGYVCALCIYSVCYQSAISELFMLQTYIEFGRLRRRLGRQLNSSYELGLMPSYPLIIDVSLNPIIQHLTSKGLD